MVLTIKGPLTLVATARAGQSDAPGGTQINLDRPWRGCQQDRDGCDEIAASYLSVAREMLRRHEERAARESLRATLRAGSYLSPPVGSDPAKPPVTRPFVGDLMVWCVMDSPRAVRSLDGSELGFLGLTADQVFDTAVRNTAAELGTSAALDASESGKHTVIVGGFYESSRLLLHNHWEALAARFGGKLLVAAPANDRIIVGDGRQSAMLATMRQAVLKARGESQRPLSAVVLEWTPAGWSEARG